MTNHLSRLMALAGLALVFSYNPRLSAATITSIGTGNWGATTTWVGGIVPTNTDNVIIATGHTVMVSSNYAAKSLTILAGGQIQGPTQTNGATLTLSGSLTNQSGDAGFSMTNPASALTLAFAANAVWTGAGGAGGDFSVSGLNANIAVNAGCALDISALTTVKFSTNGYPSFTVNGSLFASNCVVSATNSPLSFFILGPGALLETANTNLIGPAGTIASFANVALDNSAAYLFDGSLNQSATNLVCATNITIKNTGSAGNNIVSVGSGPVIVSGQLFISSGRLGLAGANPTMVGSLTYNGSTKQYANTYGSTASTATAKDDTRFSGPGTVLVPKQFRTRIGGSWSSINTWEVSTNGWTTFANATTTPGSNDVVFLQSGHQMSMSRNESSYDLHIAKGISLASTIPGQVRLGAYTLTVYGYLREYYGDHGVTPGTTTTADFASYPFLNVTSGRVSIAGNSRSLLASWSAGITTPTSGEFPLSIDLAPGQTVSLGSDLKVTGCTVNSGTLDIGDQQFKLDNGTAGQGDLTIASGARLRSSVSGDTNPMFSRTSTPGNRSGTLTVAAGGTLEINGAVPTIEMSAVDFNGLLLYGAAGDQTFLAKPLGADGSAVNPTTIGGALTISPRCNLVCGTNVLTLMASAVTNYGSLSGSRLVLSGSTAQTWAGTGAYTFGDITVNSTVTATFLGGIDVTVVGAGVTNNGIINGTGNIVLAGGAAQTLAGVGAYGGLTVSNSHNVTIPQNSSVTVSANLGLLKGTLQSSYLNSLYFEDDTTVSRSGGEVYIARAKGKLNLVYNDFSGIMGNETAGATNLTITVNSGCSLYLRNTPQRIEKLTVATGASVSGHLVNLLTHFGLVGGGGTFDPDSMIPVFDGPVTIGNLKPTSNVYYDGVDQTVAGFDYFRLYLSGSGAKTLPASGMTSIEYGLYVDGTITATLNSDLSIYNEGLTVGNTSGDAAILNVGAFPLTVKGPTVLGGAGSGTLNLTSALGAKNFEGITISTGGTWNNSGNAPVTNFGDFNFNGGTFIAGTGLYTLAGTNKTLSLGVSPTIPNLAIAGSYRLYSYFPLYVTALSILPGATFVSSGRVIGNAYVEPGASLVPGGLNSPNRMTFNGNLTCRAGGKTKLFIDLQSPYGSDNLDLGTNTLTLDGDLEIILNPISSPLPAGTYTLANFGSWSGNGRVTLNTNYSGVSLNTTSPAANPNARSITLTVGSPTELKWSGDGTEWDINRGARWKQWFEYTYSYGFTYQDYVNVTFDDTGLANPNVTVTMPVQPNAITVSNTSGSYAFSATGSGSISGTATLTKQGAGTLVLASPNSYGGETRVKAGVLKLANATGSATGSGQLTVDPGATVTGTGSISGNLLLQGTLSPGQSPGTLTVGAAELAGGGGYDWQMTNAFGTAGVGWDLLNVSGALNISATAGSPFTVNVLSLQPDNSPGALVAFDASTNQSWVIARAASISGFDPAAFNVVQTKANFANDLHGGSFSVATNYNAGLWELKVIFNANHPPVANSFSQSLAKGLTWRTTLAELLSHTSDAEGDARALTALSTPAHGTIQTNATYLVYTPTTAENDSFLYTIKEVHSVRSGDTPWTVQGTVSLTKVDKEGLPLAATYAQGKASARFAGVPNYPYQIWGAASVGGPWTLEMATNAPASGLIDFIDENPPPGAGFYKLIYNP